ncbi:MAG: MarR family transcriptional regulator, partial [Novosphingobium sp.]
MKDPLLDLPGYSLRRAAAAVMGEFVARLEPLGLRLSDVSALLLVGANPGVTASQLGRMLDIQRANMVPMIAR